MIQKSPIRVLMSSTSYPKDCSDWKGLFIRHLTYAFADEFSVDLRVWSPPGEIPDRVTYACTDAESKWLSQLMEKGGIAQVLKSRGMDALTAPSRLVWQLSRAYRRNVDVDVFHVNWLQNAIPLFGLQKPALVTVLGSDLKLLKLPGMSGILRSVFTHRKCVIAPNAEWMVPLLEKRFGNVARIQAIPFGIDEGWFSLKRIPEPGVQKWIVVSRITAAKLGTLLDWGRNLFSKNQRELHLLGPMQEPMDLPPWVIYHGPTNPRALRENWFPQASGLLTLSQHAEGRPQVMLEAMAAGLPIVASDLPAHRSLLNHQKTGWLAGDRGELEHGLNWLADSDNNIGLGKRAREYVRENIGTWHDCVGRYLRAYRSMLNPSKGHHVA